MFNKLPSKKILISLALFIVAAGCYLLYEKSKVQVTEVLEGIGSGAKNGQTAIFDYRGFLYDAKAPHGLGKEVDSTYKRHSTMKAVIGAKQVIPGLDKALIGMKPGGQRQVLIASSMAYGDTGAGDGLIPPKAKLVYLIELRILE